MFEQTLLDIAPKNNKPFTMLLSLLLQVLALGVLIVIPLIYTQVLPNAQLKSVLAAPRSPQAPPLPRAVERAKPRSIFNVRPVFLDLLPLPDVKSRPTQQVRESDTAPDLGVIDSAATGGSPFGTDFESALPAAAPHPSTAVQKSAPRQPIRVGSGPAEASLIHKVQPIYPSLAKQTRVQGIVEFTAVISKEGNIERLQLLRGHPMLVKAAQEAILQWKYRPTMLNGEPVEVITDIIVDFTLTQ